MHFKYLHWSIWIFEFKYLKVFKMHFKYFEIFYNNSNCVYELYICVSVG